MQQNQSAATNVQVPAGSKQQAGFHAISRVTFLREQIIKCCCLSQA